ncbi:Alpha,alpha-trehalose-phosphate synthase (UDP-forming) [Rhodopseudomonas palustris TIE-1]|uniref:alpha,alpha-trehalose-phosphate synthase (UDP-forming) n=1 Tax=Rhodopseudomonas palustris TaxID=1076 RepID=UPI000164B3B3|nr:trehalose-6-phosphate synthase [Rhodopseudomonas palustris]ACF02335.1 Alpha,alpha-trehalose-phosphate synthase (UDP-forming) [Rhodopseudomonas palustris TIE-1]
MQRTKTALRYLGLGILAAVVLGLAIAPFSNRLIEQWSRNDVEARSRLVYNAVQSQVVAALEEQNEVQLSLLFSAVALDPRILAVGLCAQPERLVAPTKMMPSTFSCEKVARSDAESFSTIAIDAHRIMVGAFPISHGDMRSYLVVLHDLSFIDKRSGEAQAFLLAVLFGVAVVMAGGATVFVLVTLRGWMESLRRAVEDVRTGTGSLAAARDQSIIDLQIKKLLSEVEVGRSVINATQIEWSPTSLQQLLHDILPDAEVLIVSNREPYIHNRDGDGISVQVPASGLVSALEPVIRACGGTWIAHGSGSADHETVDRHNRIDVPPDNPAYVLRRIWISEEEQEGFYYGFANEGLWPLCHIAFVRPLFRENDWRLYREINERFANAVVQEAKTEDPIVLVQDYHFALAPRMIRNKLPKATIITFWHIPWPNAETFSICPWKEEIIDGMLGSTILGFHTQFHCNNFFETVDRFVESRIDREHATVTLGGHETMIRPYPISIEWPPTALQEQPPVEKCRADIREKLGLAPDTRIAVGIERFDYTKGILDRMRAVDELLLSEPQWKGRLVFVQVAAPTRSKLTSYSTLQSDAIALADQINDRHRAGGYTPIQLLIRHHSAMEVFKLFRAADLCVVSSLHDGMNLVAKEFVAARDDECGVLVLSSFTGAARELSEALIVNPYHVHEMATALATALNMPEREQKERMRAMRKQVRASNVYRWAGRMLMDAASCRRRQRILDLAGSQPH